MNRPLWIWLVVPLFLTLPVTSHSATKLGTIWDDTIIVNASASGVKSFSGDDTITNNGTIQATKTVNLNPTATATKTGIDSGSGHDRIVNNGTIQTETTATSSEAASATATGTDAGKNNDTIENNQVVSVEARAIVPKRGNSLWDQLLGTIMDGTLDLVHKAKATAEGLKGGSGTDSLTSQGPVTVTAHADVNEPAMASLSSAHALGLSSENVTSEGPVTVTSDAAVSYDGITGEGTGIYGAEAAATATGIEAMGEQAQVAATGDMTVSTDASVSLDETASLEPLLSAALVGSLSSAASTGIKTACGDDAVDVNATLTVTADASVKANTIAASGLGATALPVPVSSATATGLDTGLGADDVTLSGSVAADASAANSSSGVAAVVAGVTVAETASLARSKAKAVDTGGGNDTLSSTADLTAHSNANASNVNLSLTGIGVDAAITGGVLATSDATALDAGAGNDTLTSSGALDATSRAAATSHEFTLQGAGFAQLNTSSTSCASATGVSLGTGTDSLENEGAVNSQATAASQGLRVDLTGIGGSVAGGTLFDSGTSATAHATGITAGAGDTTINNDGALAATTRSDATSAAITATALGAAVTTESIFANGTRATGESSGIATCLGNDQVTNTAAVTASSDAETTSVEVSATLIGVAASTASSESQATASAITTDGGSDTITNSGALTAEADADVTGIKADLAGIGVAAATGSLFNGATEATATSTGIDAGLDSDTITNTGTITGRADADTFSAEITGSLVGISLAADSLFVGGSKAKADTTAIDAGWGDDAVTNEAFLNTQAHSSATSVKLAATGLGAAITADSIVDTGTSADAEAIGIDSGLGCDTLTNRADISSAANADTVSVEGSVALIGVAASTASSEAAASASAITTDAGCDTITNSGNLTADTQADALGVKVALTGIGAAAATGSLFHGATQATATSTGIDAGLDNDTIANTGTITGNADAETLSAEFTGSLIGASLAADSLFTGGSKAKADTTAIDAGLGSDDVTNDALLKTNAHSQATAIKMAVTGLGAAITADSIVDTGTSADAESTGIDTGMGCDTLTNRADINSAADAGTVSVEGSVALIGVAASTASSEAAASASAITTDAGCDTITNSGNLTADTQADALGVKVALTGIGAAAATGSLFHGATQATATSTGINAGLDNDTIANTGTITGNADAETLSAEITGSLIGASLAADSLFAGGSKAKAGTSAIDAGWGDDTVTNTALLTTHANANATSVKLAVSGLGAAVTADSVLDTGTSAIAESNSIDTDLGNDTVINQADIMSEADATTFSGEVSAVLIGVAASISSSEADAEASAITTGAGCDTLTNSGRLDADAKANATGVKLDVAGIGGAAAVDALFNGGTTASGDATAISSGIGNDTVTNRGIIDADARANATTAEISATGLGISLTGDSLFKAGTVADASATGIATCMGEDSITNEEQITATATADTTSVAASAALIGVAVTSAASQAKAAATGIDAGMCDDTLVNLATINHRAKADTHDISLSLTGLGVAASTDSLFNGGAQSLALTTGLEGGAGNDTVESSAGITGNAESTATSVTVDFSAIGVALSANNTTLAQADATGLSGGCGNDSVTNTATVFQKTKATTTAVALDISAIGVALGLNNTTEALSRTTGMNGGWGNDALTSEGLIETQTDARATAASVALNPLGVGITDASSTARAESFGLSGDAGCDTLVNNNTINLNATGEATTGSAAINLAGMAASDASTHAVAQATGLSGGCELDTLVNNGNITTISRADTDATGVTVTLAGYGDTAADSDATASSVGMDGGSCSDSLLNNKSITTQANATADAGSVSIALAGVAMGEAGTLAQADATGMTGGAGCDRMENTAQIDATSTAHADATSADVTLAGYGNAEADATGKALATGMFGGDDGDEILNSGTIRADATASAEAGSVSVNLAGATDGHAHAVAESGSTGLSGGEGCDTALNLGTLAVTATSNAKAENCDVVLAGAGNAGADTEARSFATGFAGDAGCDSMENRGTATVTASSNLSLNGFGFTLAGATSQDGALRAASEGYGADGGEDDDLFINNGSLTVMSAASLNADSSTNAGAGVASGKLETDASALSWGLKGGAGEDTLVNNASLSVYSNAATTSNGATFAFAGSSSQSGKLTADTEATGFQGDAGSDTLVNTGTAVVTSTAALNILGDSDVAFGVASGKALSDAETIAVGFSGGDEADHLENSGSLTVTSVANTTSDKSSFSMAGSTSSGAVLTSVTDATGFTAGGGDDTVLNSGAATVTSQAVIYATGGTNVVFGGNAKASASVGTEATVTGIDGGDGNTTIINDEGGSLTLKAHGNGNARNDSDGGWFFSDAGTASNITYTLSGHGVRAGDGANTIINKGAIDLFLTNSGKAYADSNGGGAVNADAKASAEALATANAYGILAGDGDNLIDNSGTLSVSASPIAHAHAKADGDGIDGDGKAVATASTTVACWGVKLGEGDNTLDNSGTISVNANSQTIAQANADGDLGGSAIEITDQVPAAWAWGVQMGGGNNTLINSGKITVGSSPLLSFSAGTETRIVLDKVSASDLEDATLGLGDFNNYDAPVTVKTWGVALGDGANAVENAGILTVGASPVVNTAAKSDLLVKVILPDDVDEDGEEDTEEEIQSYLDLVQEAVTRSAGTSGATVSSRAWGIQAGNGGNLILNSGTLTVTVAPTVNNAATGTLTYEVDGATGNWGSTAPQTISSVNGWACGIETGAGDDTVINTGNLTVTADSFADDSASGILTNGGNDTVRNLGLIRTAEYGGTEGMAIDTGSGNDAVILEDGSETYGDIDLGSGDDTLTFIGNALVGSTIDGGADSDTLRFVGTGGNTLSFANFETCEKDGEGLYSISGLPTVTRTRLRRGTLGIESGVSLGTGHGLTAYVYGGGEHGSLGVDGAASLGGGLEVMNGGGAYTDGTLYPILTASSISGDFQETTLPEATPLLGFSLHKKTMAVQVRSNVEAFESVAQTEGQVAVAKSMDAALPTADGELAEALGAFQALPASAFPSAFDGLTPDIYTQLTLTTLCQGDLHMEALMDHLNENKPGYWADLPAARANTGSAVHPEYGDMHIEGVVVGRTLAFSPNFAAGFSINTGTAAGTPGEKSNLSESTVSEWAGYSRMSFGQAHLDTAMLFGHYQSDAQRTITFPGYAASTRASFDSRRISTLVSGGYTFENAGWAWGPMVQLAHNSLIEEGFTEAGAGSLGLSVDSRELNFFDTRLGMQASRKATTRAGTLTANISAAWDRTYGLNDLQLQARYGGSTHDTLDLNMGDVKPYGVELSTGISFQTTSGTKLSLNGAGRVSSHDNTGAISTECTIPF